MEQGRKDGATLDEYSLLDIAKSLGNWSTSRLFNAASVLLVPLCISRQSIGHFLLSLSFKIGGWSGQLGCDEHRITEHELGLQLLEAFLPGEFVPHGAHEGLSGLGSLLEGSVEVVDHVVALVDRVPNDRLHSFTLCPWLSVHIINRAMGAEEGIVHAELVESYPDLLGWNTDEAWNVSSAEDVSGKTVLHDHLDGSE